jgi:hypothetical protein
MDSLRQVLAIAGAIVVAGLVLVPAPRRLLLATAVVAVGAFCIGGEALASLARYDPIGGGGDGIAFESFAHAMLQSAERGHVVDVLRAGEPSFYFQPGLRYFRVLEKVLFGETDLGYLAVLLLLPIALLHFVQAFLPRVVAIALWVVFFLPLEWTARFFWDLRSYVDLARMGLAEALAHILWMLGAALLFRGASDGRTTWAVWGSLALSVACVLRQNLLISSAAVVALVGLRIWRAQGWRAAWPVGLAFAPYLWVPLHNLIFAGRLELAAQMGPAHVTPPRVYVQAAGDLLTGTFSGPAWQRVATHTALWVDSPARAAALVLTVIAFASRRFPLANHALALAVLGQVAVMLFWAPQGRYSHLAWQLMLVSAVANVTFLAAASAPAVSRRLPLGLAQRARAALTPRVVRVGLVATVAVVALLEIGLRMAGPDRPSADVTVPGDRPYFVTRPSSLGFRGGELPGPRDCLAVVALGGGATESARLVDRDTWPGRLESDLATTFRCVRVTNAGREGFSTFGVRRLLDDLVLPQKPAAVVLMAGYDDVARERAAPAERGPSWPTTLRHRLGRTSAVLHMLLRSPVERRNVVPSRLAAELATSPPVPVDRRQAQVVLARHEQTYVPAFRARLEEILVRARADGAEIALVTQPALYGDAVDPQTGADLRWVRVDVGDGMHGGLAWRVLELYNEATRELAREYQLPVVDLAAGLPKDSKLYDDLMHLSAEGSRQAAAIVGRELRPALARRFPQQARDVTTGGR